MVKVVGIGREAAVLYSIVFHYKELYDLIKTSSVYLSAV
jgi:hypothetical protein